MKKNYNFTIQLRCPVCGSTDIEITADKSLSKCNKCNKVFHGGLDELKELNQAQSQDERDAKKEEIQKDFEKEVHDMFKKAFKGNKYIKFK